jgi:hypothetical protein
MSESDKMMSESDKMSDIIDLRKMSDNKLVN